MSFHVLKKGDETGIPPVIQWRYINNTGEIGKSVNNPNLITFNTGIFTIIF
jgi:hypothetical protein